MSVEWKEINKCNGYTWNTVGKKIADFALFMERNTWLYCNRDRKDKRRAERARRWSNLLYYLTMGWNSFCSCILSIKKKNILSQFEYFMIWDDKQYGQAQSNRCKILTDGVTISSNHPSISNLVSLTPEDSEYTVRMLLWVSIDVYRQFLSYYFSFNL